MERRRTGTLPLRGGRRRIVPWLLFVDDDRRCCRKRHLCYGDLLKSKVHEVTRKKHSVVKIHGQNNTFLLSKMVTDIQIPSWRNGHSFLWSRVEVVVGCTLRTLFGAILAPFYFEKTFSCCPFRTLGQPQINFFLLGKVHHTYCTYLSAINGGRMHY